MIIKAKSGTGKTLVFCTIILDRYKHSINFPQSLIVAPTREIALQIVDVLNGVGAHCAGFKAVAVIGGRDVKSDRIRLNKARAVVATPGRVIHLIKDNVINLQHIQILVFDEADKLMSSNFQAQSKVLLKVLPNLRQFISASATYADDLDKIIHEQMRDAVAVSATKDIPTLIGVKEFLYTLQNDCDLAADATATATDTLASQKVMLRKVNAVEKFLGHVPYKQCILFLNSQFRAESFHAYLKANNWSTELIIGAHDQQQRTVALDKIRLLEARLVVASDLLSRGIDIDNVDMVINVDVPCDTSTYLHRIGRCGRFGRKGLAITLIDNENDRKKFDMFFNGNHTKLPDIVTANNWDLWDFSNNMAISKSEDEAVSIDAVQNQSSNDSFGSGSIISSDYSGEDSGPITTATSSYESNETEANLKLDRIESNVANVQGSNKVKTQHLAKMQSDSEPSNIIFEDLFMEFERMQSSSFETEKEGENEITCDTSGAFKMGENEFHEIAGWLNKSQEIVGIDGNEDLFSQFEFIRVHSDGPNTSAECGKDQNESIDEKLRGPIESLEIDLQEENEPPIVIAIQSTEEQSAKLPQIESDASVTPLPANSKHRKISSQLAKSCDRYEKTNTIQSAKGRNILAQKPIAAYEKIWQEQYLNQFNQIQNYVRCNSFFKQ